MTFSQLNYRCSQHARTAEHGTAIDSGNGFNNWKKLCHRSGV